MVRGFAGLRRDFGVDVEGLENVDEKDRLVEMRVAELEYILFYPVFV